MSRNKLSFSDNWDIVSLSWKDEIAIEYKKFLFDGLVTREIDIENRNNQILQDCESIIEVVKKQTEIFECLYEGKRKAYE